MTSTSAQPASTQLSELEASLLRGLSVARLAVLGWMVVVVVVARAEVANRWVAWGGLAVIAAWSTWEFVAVRSPLTERVARNLTVIEVALAAVLLVADPWVWDTEVGQRFASAWPIMPVLGAAIIWGRRGGITAALVLGAVNGLALAGRTLVGELARLSDAGGKSLSIASTAALWLVAGLAAGAVVERLRRAERAVAQAEVREELARELHDGVLQTLAVVQRRSTDDELSRLARDQELDLRAWLFGDTQVARSEPGLGPALREVARRAERTHGLRVQVVGVGLDGPEGGGDIGDNGDIGGNGGPGSLQRPSAEVSAALSGATGEAITNAAKHGGAGLVTVYAELGDEDVFVSVKDDGSGFDVDAATPGIGMTRSITGRLEAVGGRAAWRSGPAGGAEVTLRVPLLTRRPGRPGGG